VEPQKKTESAQRMQSSAKADHACKGQWFSTMCSGFPPCNIYPTIVGFFIALNYFTTLKEMKTNDWIHQIP